MRLLVRLVLALGLLVTVSAAAQAGDAGVLVVHVIDAETGAPVYHAVIHTGASWVLPDSAGSVIVRDVDATELRISALGYVTAVLPIPITGPLHVRLRPDALRVSDEVLVTGALVPDEISIHSDRQRRSTTQALAHVAGVDMVSRGHFGLEPTLRGMQGGRVGVLIDGMHMIPACVDRMDPITSYVDLGNLERLEVTKGGFDLTQAQSLAGTIDLITRKAEFTRPLALSIQSGYESASRQQNWRGAVNFARQRTAARATVALQRADDVRAGSGRRLAGTGFAKANIKLDVSRRLGSGQRLDVSVLSDRAWDVGYPTLLMDTRRAQSLLLSATHTWERHAPDAILLRSRAYHSRVDHWMDDEDRDVSQREVMRDMNMPMYGNTRTWGWRQELEAKGNTRDLRFIIDAYRLAAFADMNMLSTLPAVSPMYLLNLGDVDSDHVALAADVNQRLPRRFSLRLDVRVDGVNSSLVSAIGRRQVAAQYPASVLSRRDLNASYGVVAAWDAAINTQLLLGLARSSRQPTHSEAYGYFLYDVGDGAFYQGNPTLVAEQGDQIEFGIEHRSDRLGLSAGVYFQRVHDYISGVLGEPGFKTYANLSAAELAGLEVNAAIRPTAGVELTAGGSWIHGSNKALHEPLPMIPPAKGTAELTLTRGSEWLQLGLRLAAAQDRIARRTTLEDRTPGYAVADVRCAWQADSYVRLQLEVANIFDRSYHEHLSVGNLMARGRSINAGVVFDR